MATNTYPKVMGIININNESFFKGSRCLNTQAVGTRLLQMLEQGAQIIDIGACSTRPGSTPVSATQEWEYLKEPLKYIAENFIGKKNLPEFEISIDTFREDIVRRVYDVIGNFIVNDISAGEDDKNMLKCVGELKLPYIAMHKRGVPNTMQQLCQYPNGVVNEIISYFKEFENRASKFGIKDYILDPGFGFAKTIDQNYQLFNGMKEIISNLQEYSGVKRKLLVGISRKTMLWKPLGITPDNCLPATAAINLQALLLGADIIRVHDVIEGVQCLKLFELITTNMSQSISNNQGSVTL